MKVLLLGEGDTPSRRHFATIFPENVLEGDPVSGLEVKTFGYTSGVDVPLPRGAGVEELQRALEAASFTPDLCLLWFPEGNLIPTDIGQAPFPVVNYLGDWDYDIELTRTLLRQADLTIAISRAEADALRDLGARATATFYGQGMVFIPQTPLPLARRPIDVLYTSFVDDDHHPDRSRWMVRLSELSERYTVRIVPPSPDYGRYLKLLDESKLVFSTQRYGSMSNRVVESLARGAVPIDPGAHVDEHFAPDHEYLRLDEERWRAQIEGWLARSQELQAIADRGHQRVSREYRSADRFARLCAFALEQLPEERGQRPPPESPGQRARYLFYAAFRSRVTARDELLGQARAAYREAATSGAIEATTGLAVIEAARGFSDEPSVFSAQGAPALIALLSAARAEHPRYAMTAVHLAILAFRAGAPTAGRRVEEALATLADPGATIDTRSLQPRDFELFDTSWRGPLNEALRVEQPSAIARCYEALLHEIAATLAERAGALHRAIEHLDASLRYAPAPSVLRRACTLKALCGDTDGALRLHEQLAHRAPLDLDPQLSWLRLLYLERRDRELLLRAKRLASVTAAVAHRQPTATPLQHLLASFSRLGPLRGAVDVATEELKHGWAIELERHLSRAGAFPLPQASLEHASLLRRSAELWSELGRVELVAPLLGRVAELDPESAAALAADCERSAGRFERRASRAIAQLGKLAQDLKTINHQGQEERR